MEFLNSDNFFDSSDFVDSTDSKSNLLENNTDLFKVYHFDNKFRLGSNTDSGYVIGDLNINYDCLISCGISQNDDFSIDFINKYNLNKENCFAFDGTIKDIPSNLKNIVTFIKKNIGFENSDSVSNLSSFFEKYDNIFLKMDIEGGEWPWFQSMDQIKLSKISQLVIELHGITNVSWHGMTVNSFGSDYHEKIQCLKKITSTHYLIHAHGNNHDLVSNNGLPNVIELTYINKNLFDKIPELNSIPLPIKGLDFSNNPGYPDINLNFYPFVTKLSVNPFLIDIPDKEEYSIDDYINIQTQLDNKNIDNIIESFYSYKNMFYTITDFNSRITRGIRQKLINTDNNLLPTKNLYKIGDGGNNRNCIVCCTPFTHLNDNYDSRFNASQNIHKSLEETGFNGHFYLFNGGFPNPTGTEMKYVGVPYCFKIFMMLEAYKKGFDKVIWIDSGCYALNNPEQLFNVLYHDDALIKTVDSNNNYNAMTLESTMCLLNRITNSELQNAKYIETIVFGLNLESIKVKSLIKEYYEMVKLGYPFFSIFPEEIVLSSLFNKNKYKNLLTNYSIKNKLHVSEKTMDENSARKNGYYFHHKDYSKYKSQSSHVIQVDNENVFPLSFSIPDECVVEVIPRKTCLLASLIPGDISTYIFNKYQEKEYNNMYRQSRFAITKMKGGWDCLRHYEILMNGCIPLFENLKDCPKDTLTSYPKELNNEAYELFNNWIENEECINKYNILCSKFLEHTRKNCTTSACAKYFLKNIKNGDKIKNILLLTCHHGNNYNRESLWIGLKRYIKSIGGVGVEYEKLPFLYDDFDSFSENKYYGNNCYTFPKRLKKDDDYYMSESEIIDKINNNFWDLIIYGKVGPDEFCTFPFYDIIKPKYNKNQIAFLYGGDEIFNLNITDSHSYHVNMFNRNIYYKPYSDYLNYYKQFGYCFVRELEK